MRDRAAARPQEASEENMALQEELQAAAERMVALETSVRQEVCCGLVVVVVVVAVAVCPVEGVLVVLVLVQVCLMCLRRCMCS